MKPDMILSLRQLSQSNQIKSRRRLKTISIYEKRSGVNHIKIKSAVNCKSRKQKWSGRRLKGTEMEVKVKKLKRK